MKQFDIYYLGNGEFVYENNYKFFKTAIDGNGVEIFDEEISEENFNDLKQNGRQTYNFFRPGGEEERSLDI